jgi:hypothetical protein
LFKVDHEFHRMTRIGAGFRLGERH